MTARLTPDRSTFPHLDGPVLILGAAYTGKSEIAQNTLEPQAKTVVIGTADLREGLLRSRVEELRKLRPAHWDHVEAGADLGAQLSSLAKVYPQILLDSLNQWVANRMIQNVQKYSIEQLTQHLELEAKSLYQAIESLPSGCRIVMVSSEVGAGIAPPKAVARVFRQTVSRINCQVAALSPSVLLVSAGIPMLIKGSWPAEALSQLEATTALASKERPMQRPQPKG